MFVGHYSAALVLKAAKPRLPLWLMFLAVQAVDIGWGLLVLCGIEKARVVPGFTAAFPVDLYYMPYTHSLLSVLVWSAALGLAYLAWRRHDGIGTAVALAAAVASHWLLDLPVHVPDLPLYGNQHKLGFGLWNHPLQALALELGLLALAFLLCVRRFPQWARRAWLFLAALALVQVVQTLGPWLLPNATAVALAALCGYFVFAGAAALVERPVYGATA